MTFKHCTLLIILLTSLLSCSTTVPRLTAVATAGATDDSPAPWNVVWIDDTETDTLTPAPSPAGAGDVTSIATITDITDSYHTITGSSLVDADGMYRFVIANNPDFDRNIAEAFHSISKKYGVRGDMAFCQAILETGWFKFTGGTKVTPDQHNYCGLGVTKLGMKGHSFPTVEDGVTAQIQHLYAYAVSAPLPKGEKLIDPRFHKVRRGCAPTWNDLSGRWAANPRYAERILDLYAKLLTSARQTCKE